MTEKSADPKEMGRAASARAAIELLGKAAEANIATPRRNGGLIEPEGRGEILITGDLHGNIDTYMRINRIADLMNKPDRLLLLQELTHQENNVANTICRSHRLIEMAARLKTIMPDRVILLMGNHEFAEITDLKIAKRGQELNENFARGLMAAYGESWGDVFEALRDFLSTFALAIRTPNGVFISHSTPSGRKLEGLTLDFLRSLKPGEGLDRKSPVYNMLWGRDYSAETADKFARQVDSEIFIVAHTPCENGYSMPSHRHIMIDSASPNGRCLLMPLDAPADQAKIAEGIMRIYRDKKCRGI